MQTDPTARHSPIGSFQRVCYLVHLARDGRMAAAPQLGATWPSLRKAFTRHGLGMPARNPEAVRQRTSSATSCRGGPPAAPPLDPVFVALNQGELPTRRGPHTEQGGGCAAPRRSRRSATALTAPNVRSPSRTSGRW